LATAAAAAFCVITKKWPRYVLGTQGSHEPIGSTSLCPLRVSTESKFALSHNNVKPHTDLVDRLGRLVLHGRHRELFGGRRGLHARGSHGSRTCSSALEEIIENTDALLLINQTPPQSTVYRVVVEQSAIQANDGKTNLLERGSLLLAALERGRLRVDTVSSAQFLLGLLLELGLLQFVLIVHIAHAGEICNGKSEARGEVENRQGLREAW